MHKRTKNLGLLLLFLAAILVFSYRASDVLNPFLLAFLLAAELKAERSAGRRAGCGIEREPLEVDAVRNAVSSVVGTKAAIKFGLVLADKNHRICPTGQ